MTVTSDVVLDLASPASPVDSATLPLDILPAVVVRWSEGQFCVWTGTAWQ